MRAVVFKATREVAVEDVPDARVERDDDVVVRVTSSALCGTDLHMYDGRTGAAPGTVLGHERARNRRGRRPGRAPRAAR